jgi:hypothetical protein
MGYVFGRMLGNIWCVLLDCATFAAGFVDNRDFAVIVRNVTVPEGIDNFLDGDGAVGFILVVERDSCNRIAAARLVRADVLGDSFVDVGERIRWNAGGVAGGNDLNRPSRTVGNPHYVWCGDDVSVHGRGGVW